MNAAAVACATVEKKGTKPNLAKLTLARKIARSVSELALRFDELPV